MSSPHAHPSSRPALVAAAPDPWIGSVLAGRYTLVGKLGAGSMGSVYRAKQIAVDRPVAVKIVKDERSLDAAANARFLREARANSLLVSPHTVQVLDFGQAEGGALFLVMELLEGESLRRRLSRMGRFPADVAIETCLGMLRSLAEAHAKGVIHRDLKPEHVFFARVKGEKQDDEIVKVLDFGIAKMVGDESKHLNAVETREGRILGTPRYMSPEQAQGKPLDARSDLYTVGLILYEMLTGRAPFTADDPIVVMAQHITKTPRLPTEACPEAHVIPELERLVMRSLSKNPGVRPASAEELAEELTGILAGTAEGLAAVARRSVRISSAPPALASGSGERGTPGGVVVPGPRDARESETIPTVDGPARTSAAGDGTTLEQRPRRRGRAWSGFVAGAAVAGVVGAVAVGAMWMRAGASASAGVGAGAGGSESAGVSGGATNGAVAAGGAGMSGAAASAVPAASPSSSTLTVSVDALPSASPVATSRRPPATKGSTAGGHGAARNPPAAPRGSSGYDYLE